MHDEIKDLKKQNFEAKMIMYKEILIIYVKCLIKYPKNKELRNKLVRLMRGFFINLKNEVDIWNTLETSLIDEEEFIKILDLMDELFLSSWEYYDGILHDFEDGLELNDFSFVMHQNEVIKNIDEEKKEEFMQMILKAQN